MSSSVLGLDVGGAHLKAARLAGGRLAQVRIEPCALWKGLGELEAALERALFGAPSPDLVAVTMTGELVDLFPDRPTGVRTVLGLLERRFGAGRLAVFAARATFLPLEEAARQPDAVASVNWLATASHLARRLEQGLLVDIGSTTTDLVPFAGARVAARGWSDAERLALDELVYTGVVRTPVMALAPRLPFAGAWIAPMAELFATTADVHRLTGDLPEDADLHPAADSGAKTVEASARRLLRMVGADLGDEGMEDARQLAAFLAEMQLSTIHAGAVRVLSAHRAARRGPVVGAGVGRFLARRLADRLGLPYRDIGSELTEDEALQAAAADAAPAVATALIAAGSLKG